MGLQRTENTRINCQAGFSQPLRLSNEDYIQEESWAKMGKDDTADGRWGAKGQSEERERSTFLSTHVQESSSNAHLTKSYVMNFSK